MKKLLASLLAVVLCLSLTACGVEERIAQLDRNVYEVIEITVDNWQDYFEIVEVTVWETDEAGEVVDCYGVITSLCLKEEFADRTVSENTELEFKYTALRHICEFTADLEDAAQMIKILGQIYLFQRKIVNKLEIMTK